MWYNNVYQMRLVAGGNYLLLDWLIMGQGARQAFGHTVTSKGLCAQMHIRSFFQL